MTTATATNATNGPSLMKTGFLIWCMVTLFVLLVGLPLVVLFITSMGANFS